MLLSCIDAVLPLHTSDCIRTAAFSNWGRDGRALGQLQTQTWHCPILRSLHTWTWDPHWRPCWNCQGYAGTRSLLVARGMRRKSMEKTWAECFKLLHQTWRTGLAEWFVELVVFTCHFGLAWIGHCVRMSESSVLPSGWTSSACEQGQWGYDYDCCSMLRGLCTFVLRCKML